MQKVIFDTNSIRNNWWKKFFWNIDELKNFTWKCEIIIPSIVIEEIKNQKFKELKKQKDNFLTSPFLEHYWVTWCKSKECKIEDIIEKLEKDEWIDFKIIDLEDHSKILEIKKLAVKNEPPFEPWSDKWFKDTYIYYSVLDFLERIEDKIVYFVTKDQTLTKAFSKIERVKVIKDFNEFEKNSDLYFKQEYFLGILWENLWFKISEKDILDISFNINDNWLLITEPLFDKYIVEIDFTSKEIIWIVEKSEFEENIEILINSWSFRNTHNCIYYLNNYIQYFNNNEIEALLLASIDNIQILWISWDDDVKQFFTDLYEKSKIKLDENNDRKFCDNFEIKSKYYNHISILDIPF